MTDRTSASWLVYALGILCAGAIAAAILVVGPASGSQASRTRTATVAEGVVQSTVSGSGNLQAASQLNLGFKTSGTVEHIYVTQGQQVTEGQLLAALDPQSAEVTLEQSKAALQSAEASLAKEEETGGAGSTGSGTAAGGGVAAATASVHRTRYALIAAAASAPEPTTPATHQAAPPTSAPSPAKTPATTPAQTNTTTPAHSDGTSGSSTSETKEPSPSVSPATREANLASARAQVRSDALTVQGDEQAVQDTKLYAPENGTIVSLSGQVGETTSGGGTTRASSSASSSGSAATGSAAAAGTRSGAGTTAASASGSSSSSSSSSFAVLSDLSSMELVAPLSESEIGSVKVGQLATVTVEALESRKLAAHVGEVAILSTSNSGVVSYDVTFRLDQLTSGLKPGMSATAEVVVKQAEGVNVPTTAISGGTVTVIAGGRQTPRRVVTGLRGNSSTIILSGLRAGEQIALPVASSTSGASGGITSRLAGRAGGLGGAAGGLGGGGLGGGGGAFFRGGG
jgi:multidrug efflux pump subunit AcrA (membrane-fusion protein)